MQLLMLGGLSVDGGKKTRQGAASQRKALALLALLGGAGRRGLSRDKLIALLWPDSPTDHALHSLTQLLYSLKRRTVKITTADARAGVIPLPASIDTGILVITRANAHSRRVRAT